MKIKVFVLSLFLVAGGVQANAQGGSKYVSENRNEFRISYSDGLTLGTASFWGMGLGDALTGTQRSDTKASGVIGLGYRYHLNRFRAGLDVGFASVSSKSDYAGSKKQDIKETQLNFMIMPVAELVYYKKGIFELYGSAAAGVDLTRTKKKGLTDRGKEHVDTKAKTSAEFAFQVNPIALRVGNEHIGGYLEAGLGYKGFVTAGVSVKF
ncbi:MAG: hypothetical protein K6A82_01075 [Prevotella sp.]|nr:hypothetical protein [Prevotella sp.]